MKRIKMKANDGVKTAANAKTLPKKNGHPNTLIKLIAPMPK